MKIATFNIGQIHQRDFEYEPTIDITMKMRDCYTDGKFVTKEEYARIIRKLKLKEIYKY